MDKQSDCAHPEGPTGKLAEPLRPPPPPALWLGAGSQSTHGPCPHPHIYCFAAEPDPTSDEWKSLDHSKALALLNNGAAAMPESPSPNKWTATESAPGHYYFDTAASCARAWDKQSDGPTCEPWRGEQYQNMDCGEDSFMLDSMVLGVGCLVRYSGGGSTGHTRGEPGFFNVEIYFLSPKDSPLRTAQWAGG